MYLLAMDGVAQRKVKLSHYVYMPIGQYILTLADFIGRRPQIHYSKYALRLNDLKYQIAGWKRTISKSEGEKEENEAKWARLRLKMDERDAVWDRLDDAARRNYHELPVKTFSKHSERKDDRRTTSKRATASITPLAPSSMSIQALSCKEEHSQAQMATQALQRQQLTDMDKDNADRWEEEYGIGLEKASPPAMPESSDLDDTSRLYAGLSLGSSTVAAVSRDSEVERSHQCAIMSREASIQAQWMAALEQSTSPRTNVRSGWDSKSPEPRGFAVDGWEAAWPATQASFTVKQELLSDTSFCDTQKSIHTQLEPDKERQTAIGTEYDDISNLTLI